jgi:hypothetical protein
MNALLNAYLYAQSVALAAGVAALQQYWQGGRCSRRHTSSRGVLTSRLQHCCWPRGASLFPCRCASKVAASTFYNICCCLQANWPPRQHAQSLIGSQWLLATQAWNALQDTTLQPRGFGLLRAGLRYRVVAWNLFSEPQSSRCAYYVSLTLMLTILVSTVVLCLDSIPEIQVRSEQSSGCICSAACHAMEVHATDAVV